MSIEMLWGSQAEAIIADSFHGAKWQSERDRKQDAAWRLDIFEDDWQDLAQRKIFSIYRSPKIQASVQAMISTEINVLKRITNELSTVYKRPAAREIVGDPRQNDLAKMLWAETEIDNVLDLADHYLTFLRDILIVPWVEDGEMRLEVLTPDDVTIIQHPRIPSRAAAFWWERSLVNTDTRGRTIQSEIIFADDNEWRIYDASGSKIISRRPHGRGRLPAVVVHASHRRQSFWLPTEFDDVVQATLMVSVLLTMMSRLQYLQSELQPTYQGEVADIAKGQTIGGDTVWAGPGTWGVLNLQADPKIYLDTINARIGWIAQGHGLAAEVYNLTGAPSSGFQIRLKRLPLMEARRTRVKIWSAKERELYRLMAMVSGDLPPARRLDPMARFEVNHADEEFLEDPKTEIDVFDGQIRQGRISPIDPILRDDPDLTREQAMEKLKRNLDERAVIVEMQRKLQAPADVTEPAQSPVENGAMGQGDPMKGGMAMDSQAIHEAAAAALAKMRSSA